MPVIRIPGETRFQPRGPVEIDTANPLGAKCLFMWTPTQGLVVPGAGRVAMGVYTGTAPTADMHYEMEAGRVREFHPSGGANGPGGINTRISSGSNVTMFHAGYPQTTDSNALDCMNRGLSGDSMRMRVSGQASYIYLPPAQFDCNLVVSLQVDRFEQKALTKRGNTLTNFDWRTRQSLTLSGGTGDFRSDSAGDFFYINHNNLIPKGHIRHLVNGAFDALTDEEVWELFDNPWQVYQEVVQRFYSLPAATIPSSLNVAASNITSSGARATVTLVF